ncbi:LysR family transcriptional regulator [Exilibacterium tricleocarpae]|uniref:LysR family transcriptional regulator n=1 Tax=Exilibacterium tricleocarpae TaxID=2591008 RepID=A0A545TFQ1_9GAMM|nr:LysR family transcriptional regulator [Exilibacterium tricleocarpae]TQV76028.1 LysR family transcriptional regulator [Exilibacterium tricleocarpae]
MELSQLEAFVAIAEAKGFSKAANKLNLTQPAISRRIRQLEDMLGASLFDRIATGVVLTEPGESFLPYARRAIASVRDGVDIVRDGLAQARGAVSCALVGTLASTGITDAMHAYCRAYPQVELTLRTASSAVVSTLVLNGEVNLGVRYFDDPNPDLKRILLGDERVVPVAAGDVGDQTQASVPLSQLYKKWLSFPLEQHAAQFNYPVLLRRQVLQAGIEGVEFVDVDSLTAQKRMIEAGFGCGLLPLSSMQEELDRGTLRVLDWPQLCTGIPVYLIYRSRAYISPALQCLVTALQTATL